MAQALKRPSTLTQMTARYPYEPDSFIEKCPRVGTHQFENNRTPIVNFISKLLVKITCSLCFSKLKYQILISMVSELPASGCRMKHPPSMEHFNFICNLFFIFDRRSSKIIDHILVHIDIRKMFTS